ncbi:hypothetical protein V2G26_007426 [Clonostachys chloroleuca]
MFEAKKMKIWCLYLPSHSSHATQPLDVGLFSPLKGEFKQQNAFFQTFKVKSVISKQPFIKVYAKASEKAFTPDNIKGSFHGAGIWPLDIKQPLKQLQDPKLLPFVPTTSPLKPEPYEMHIITPSSSKEVRDQVDSLRDNLKTVDSSARLLYKKVGKELDRKNSQIAALQHRNDYPEAEIASQQPLPRRTVQEDPNRLFPTIEQVVQARERAHKAGEAYARAHEPALEAEAREITQADENELYHTFQPELP